MPARRFTTASEPAASPVHDTFPPPCGPPQAAAPRALPPSITARAAARPPRAAPSRLLVCDASLASQTFSMLMGDEVEPRRQFIEQNAKDVRFLDV